MPDQDATHFWVTHRSLSVLSQNNQIANVQVSRPGQSDYGMTRTREDGLPSQGRGRKGINYSISFPEGHTTSLFWPDDLEAEDSQSNAMSMGRNAEYPAYAEYMKGKREIKRKNVGNRLINIGEGPHVFPNLGFLGRAIRVLHPEGPERTEMWTYFLVDKSMPQEARDQLARNIEVTFGPGGMQQKDDMENWYILTQYSKGLMTRRTPLNAYLRLNEGTLKHGPSDPHIQMPGMWSPDYTDENTRIFYHRWAEVLTANSWDDLKVESAK
jgi:hypothetical protein